MYTYAGHSKILPARSAQADKCSGPKGSSSSFSRDAQSSRIRARNLGLFAEGLLLGCLCTYCRLMKDCTLRAPVNPASLPLDVE